MQPWNRTTSPQPASCPPSLCVRGELSSACGDARRWFQPDAAPGRRKPRCRAGMGGGRVPVPGPCCHFLGGPSRGSLSTQPPPPPMCGPVGACGSLLVTTWDMNTNQ